MHQRWYPTIYALDSPDPLCVLKTPSDYGHGYQSVATVKTGDFGIVGTKEYFISGSDDFRAYVWEVPSEREMKNGRQVHMGMDPANRQTAYLLPDGATMSPYEVSDAAFTLKGHRSVVNSTLIHPHQPLIFTAGVEKVVRMFSPFPLSTDDISSDMSPSKPTAPTERTRLPPAARGGGDLLLFAAQEPDDSIEEDFRTLAFFDVLLAEDERIDPLWGTHLRRRGRPSGSTSSSSSSSEEDDDDANDETGRTGQISAWASQVRALDEEGKVTDDEVVEEDEDSDAELERLVGGDVMENPRKRRRKESPEYAISGGW
ncbi:hypothetical protein HK104_000779 [Borealophlyctis nickersoniae]|nr:hypothetical protein HK104_000779 [Borealophlyctis nickersoniae]